MVNYRLLALDLDGTVLTKDGTITAETKLWISKAKAAGVVVIFATGRGLHENINFFREELDLDTPMVLANGGEIWKNSEEILMRCYINKKDIHMLYTLSVEANADFGGYSAGDEYYEMNVWNDNMFDFNWITFSIRHKDPLALNKLRKHVENSTTLEVIETTPSMFDFSFKNVSKESGVKKVCEYLNIGMESVMAIGDSMNDLRLIQSAGLGVAMANAKDELKKTADKITTSNEEDGVAEAIKKYLLT